MENVGELWTIVGSFGEWCPEWSEMIGNGEEWWGTVGNGWEWLGMVWNSFNQSEMLPICMMLLQYHLSKVFLLFQYNTRQSLFLFDYGYLPEA